MNIPPGVNRPVIADTDWIAPTAVVVADVQLADNVSVWYGAVLRADGDRISIGSGTNIQDNCVLHSNPGMPVRIGTGVSVGHAPIIHGAWIEDDVIIGMGATVMNRAKVGAETLIAANALVPEEKAVPSGVLFAGVPGKVVRKLTQQETADIRVNANRCHELAVAHASSSLSTT